MNQITQYFQNEKSESLLFLIIGLVAIGFSIYGLLILKTDFWKGAAWPLVIIGLIQLVVGSVVFFRTDAQLAAIEAQYQSAPALMAQTEILRMEGVNKSFVVYRYAEILLLAIGLVVAFMLRENTFWGALGIMLFAQSALMLLADYFAENRALAYLEYLKTIQ